MQPVFEPTAAPLVGCGVDDTRTGHEGMFSLSAPLLRSSQHEAPTCPPCAHWLPTASHYLPVQERKELIGKKLNEQHNNWGSLLLGLGVTISVSGAFNTFLRTGAGGLDDAGL